MPVIIDSYYGSSSIDYLVINTVFMLKFDDWKTELRKL